MAAHHAVVVDDGRRNLGEHWTDDAVDYAAKLFQETNAEDRVVLEGLARSLASSSYAPGPLASAAFEGPIHDFHRYLGGRLGPALSKNAD